MPRSYRLSAGWPSGFRASRARYPVRCATLRGSRSGVPLAPLLDRMWELRANVTAYDAAYVAVAEELAAPVITCDGKLAAASGPRCEFELIS